MRDKLTRLLNTKKNILFVGIGNVLKHDDGVGVYICDHIAESKGIKAFSAEQSIENYVGKINRSSPDWLVLVDSVLFGRQTGFADLIPVKELIDHTTHTHNISLKQIGQLFLMPVYVLGIEPGDISFGEGLSPEVKSVADEIVGIVNGIR